MNINTTSRRIILGVAAATALVSIGAGAAQAARPSNGDVTCSTTLRNTTVRGDLTVKVGETCTLNRVQVRGDLVVPGTSTLVARNSQLRGDLDVQGFLPGRGPSRAVAELHNTTVTGRLSQSTATSVTTRGGSLGSVRVDGGFYWGNLSLTNTTVRQSVVGNHRTQLSMDRSTIRGNLKTDGATSINRSTVRGRSTVGAYSSTFCGSTLSDLSVGTYYGATLGDGRKCAGNVIRGDLTFPETTITLTMNRNTVFGDVTVPGEIHRILGDGNRFRGSIPQEFRRLR